MRLNEASWCVCNTSNSVSSTCRTSTLQNVTMSVSQCKTVNSSKSLAYTSPCLGFNRSSQFVSQEIKFASALTSATKSAIFHLMHHFSWTTYHDSERRKLFVVTDKILSSLQFYVLSRCKLILQLAFLFNSSYQGDCAKVRYQENNRDFQVWKPFSLWRRHWFRTH
jgi:hypothetical protein